MRTVDNRNPQDMLGYYEDRINILRRALQAQVEENQQLKARIQELQDWRACHEEQLERVR